MFYRWAKRLDSMQFPATAFPAAGGDPIVETDDAHELDGALIAGGIASLWILLQMTRATGFVTLDWAVITYVPLILVGLLAALLVRPPAPLSSIAPHVAAYVGLAVLMGETWATSVGQAIVWAAFFALLGLITTLLLVVVWAVLLRQLATPRTMLFAYAQAFRALCVAVILLAALISLSKAITIPLMGL